MQMRLSIFDMAAHEMSADGHFNMGTLYRDGKGVTKFMKGLNAFCNFIYPWSTSCNLDPWKGLFFPPELVRQNSSHTFRRGRFVARLWK